MFKFIMWLVISVFIFLLADIGRYAVYPDVSGLVSKNPIPTAFMEYRKEQWAKEGRQKEITHKWVSYKSISPNLVKAVLISEDDGFYKNDGFETEEMKAAFERNLKEGRFAAGGSTITQQLAKNIYLSPSKNPIRKIKEAILTYRMNKALSKRRIAELYLNCAEWGDGIFGIEAAARHYYGKSAKNLTAMESAKLAAILPNPILYQPEQSGKVAKKAARLYRIMSQRGVVVKAYEETLKPSKEEAKKEAQEEPTKEQPGPVKTEAAEGNGSA